MNTSNIANIISIVCQQVFKLKIKAQVVYPDSSFGDFATNIAFQLSKKLHKKPIDIANKLLPYLKGDLIEEVSVAGPGFINFIMTPAFWIKQLELINQNYGKANIGKGQKVQVEYISANPTGPLTLGNARGGYIGDVLARVLTYLGYNVVKEYYFNDAGTQITKLIESVKIAAGLIKSQEQEYKGIYIDNLANTYKKELISENDEKLAEIITQDIIKNQIKPAIKQMKIEYDTWFNERDLVSKFNNTIKRLERKNLIYNKENATWLKTTELGDDEDRVIRKSNGDITYLGNDISYHINIFEDRKFDRAIKIWGADHAGQVDSLKLTIKQLFPEKILEFIILQWVRLIKDKKEVLISKRAGTYITVPELINEIGTDVARFFFLSSSYDNQMDFDLSLAKDRSEKNPLYYIMYSYARSNSILDQATKKGLKIAQSIEEISPKEKNLIKTMSQFPELIKEVSEQYNVHQLTFYGIKLSKLFHDYYESEHIISLKPSLASQKLYLIQQYHILIDCYFNVLGIKPNKKM